MKKGIKLPLIIVAIFVVLLVFYMSNMFSLFNLNLFGTTQEYNFGGIVILLIVAIVAGTLIFMFSRKSSERGL